MTDELILAKYIGFDVRDRIAFYPYDVMSDIPHVIYDDIERDEYATWKGIDLKFNIDLNWIYEVVCKIQDDYNIIITYYKGLGVLKSPLIDTDVYIECKNNSRAQSLFNICVEYLKLIENK